MSHPIPRDVIIHIEPFIKINSILSNLPPVFKNQQNNLLNYKLKNKIIWLSEKCGKKLNLFLWKKKTLGQLGIDENIFYIIIVMVYSLTQT